MLYILEAIVCLKCCSQNYEECRLRLRKFPKILILYLLNGFHKKKSKKFQKNDH